MKMYQSVIWISYRSNFPIILHDELEELPRSDYISDTGWGCMIRVGQMAFAEGLRRHLKLKKGKKVTSRTHLLPEINAFLDDDEKSDDIAPYSIQKIAKLAL